MRPVRLNRAAPKLAPAQLVTYAIRSPLDTHTRPATCAEYGCEAHANGWVTVVDETTDLGRQQAGYIRRACVRDSATLRPDVLGGRRRYTETRQPDGTTAFAFPAGQECFAEHRVSLERPELYLVRGGDWRGNPTRFAREHTRPEHWVEDFADHQQQLADAQERG